MSPPVDGAHVDVAVVGSGFGGAIAGHRLAEAGLSVAILERGHEHPPGSFPRTPREFGRAMWAPDDGLHGPWDYWSFRGIDAVVASGVGGGSLIYANVLLRKDEATFAGWPVGRAELDPHYATVERELGATPFPADRAPWSLAPKTRAFAAAARRAGHEPFHPPLAVTWGERPGEPFADGGRQSCRLCGECTIGCNFGAKNTLDLTYLAHARTRAATFPGCDVQRIEPLAGGGYRLGYRIHDPDGPEPQRALRTLTATRVVLAAGALATTRLLLANRRRLPRLGPALGSRFSGNGDLLTFAVSSSEDLDPSHGPTITTAIRGPEGRWYLEDAGVPLFMMWMAQAADAPRALWRYRRFVARYLPLKLGLPVRTDMSAAVAGLVGPSRRAHGTLPLLGMGHDTPDGVLSLSRAGRLKVSWRAEGSRAFFTELRAAARAVAEELGGTFADSPLWRLRRGVTVHPLGGAPMGRSVAEGVVDARGEAFGHPGLYVTCGAAMPGPVGPNPALTIGAWAEHVAAGMLDDSSARGASPRAEGGG